MHKSRGCGPDRGGYKTGRGRGDGAGRLGGIKQALDAPVNSVVGKHPDLDCALAAC